MLMHWQIKKVMMVRFDLKPRLDIIIGHYVTKELIQVKGSHVYVRLRKVNDVLLDANLDRVDFVHY